jgi:hypothetical protein
MSIMKTRDRGNEFLSKNFEPAGKYFLVSQPAVSGVNSAIESKNIICSKDISNCE